jgi:hypothetical protein
METNAENLITREGAKLGAFVVVDSNAVVMSEVEM